MLRRYEKPQTWLRQHVGAMVNGFNDVYEKLAVIIILRGIKALFL